MAVLPTILISDFDCPNISYRIAATRAERHGELLALARRVFDKPFGEYDAHIHFDAKKCEGRAAESEWDDRAYLSEEFVGKGEGKLVVWVHFVRAAKEEVDFAKGEKLVGRIEEMKRELKCEAIKMEVVKTDTEAMRNRANADASQSPLPTPGYTPIGSSYDDAGFTLIDDCTSEYIQENGLVIGHAKPSRCIDPTRRPLARAILADTKFGQSVRAFIPVKYGIEVRKSLRRTSGEMQIPIAEVELLEQFREFRLRSSKDSIAKIKEALLRNLEQLKKENEEETKRLKSLGDEAMEKGDFALAEGYYAAALELIPESATAHQRDSSDLEIYDELDDHSDINIKQENDPHAEIDLIPTNPTGVSFATTDSTNVTTIDDTTSRRLLETGIIIGRARTCVCRDPNQRPLVRGIIDYGKHSRLCAYMPTKYSSYPTRKNGDVQIRMTEVDFIEQFESVPFGEKRVKAIKEAIMRKNEAREGASDVRRRNFPKVWKRSVSEGEGI